MSENLTTMNSSSHNVDKKPVIQQPYVCPLSEDQKKRALVEFYETDAIRDKWIQDLRQWALANRNITNCRLSDLFLLRFLRYTKFARWCEVTVLAQEALQRYLVMREIYPEWCLGLDPWNKPMRKMTDDEVFTILGMDDNGCTIVWIRLGRFDVSHLDPVVILRYTMLFLECLLEDEKIQVGGIKVWVDYEKTKPEHFTVFPKELLKEFKKVIEKVVPICIREVHNVRLPEFARIYRTLLTSVTTELFKFPTYWHSTVAESKKHFPEFNWPKQYGGCCDPTLRVRHLKQRFNESRDALLKLDQMDYNVQLIEIKYFKLNYWRPENIATDATLLGGSAQNMAPIKTVSIQLEGEFMKVDVQIKTGAVKKSTKKTKGKKVIKKKAADAQVKSAKNDVKPAVRKSVETVKKDVKKPSSETFIQKKPWKF